MIFRRYLRAHLPLALGYLFLLEGALAAAIFWWPDFRDNIPTFAKIIPIETLRKLIEGIEKGGFWPYLILQQFFKGANLFGVAVAAVLGTGLIAREADQKTAEFLLSRPVSRTSILLQRWAAGCLLLVVPLFLSSLSAIPLAAAPSVGEHVAMGPLLAASAYASLFLILLFTVTVLLSSLFENQLLAGVILIGFCLFEFSLYLVKTIGHWSIYRLVDVNVYLPFATGAFPWTRAGIFAGLTLGLLGTALAVFGKRDF